MLKRPLNRAVITFTKWKDVIEKYPISNIITTVLMRCRYEIQKINR